MSRLLSISAVLIAVVVIGLVGCGYVVAYKQSERTEVITVEDKESVTKSSGSGESLSIQNEYRVYTDKGVFVVSDSFVYLNFRAADRYAGLKVGRTYSCKTAGWRFGLFSWFPNLIDCEEVSRE